MKCNICGIQLSEDEEHYFSGYGYQVAYCVAGRILTLERPCQAIRILDEASGDTCRFDVQGIRLEVPEEWNIIRKVYYYMIED